MRENFKHKALFQNPTQFKKLDNVDYNFWVRVPERLEDGIKVYEYFALTDLGYSSGTNTFFADKVTIFSIHLLKFSCCS